ncbi:hypothetical protein M0802_001060 [Mischocyttarus mexicanus]|nr:hypothetical protein M0802_001060 [Mischocyttarus mexicanus]
MLRRVTNLVSGGGVCLRYMLKRRLDEPWDVIPICSLLITSKYDGPQDVFSILEYCVMLGLGYTFSCCSYGLSYNTGLRFRLTYPSCLAVFLRNSLT